MKTLETIPLNIINNPPVFIPDPTAYIVLSIYNYTTNIVDPEGNSVTITTVTGNPSFMTLQSDLRTFAIAPPYNIANGTTYPVTITFTDGCNTPSATFHVVIINQKPYFISALVNQTVYGGSIVTYYMP